MGKQFKNVPELIKNLSSDNNFIDSVLHEIKNKSISKFLFFLRCEHKLTQGDLAKKIGCSQSRISKIESSYDKEVTVQDLLDYGNALGLELELGYRPRNVRIIDMIKFHAFKIKDYLQRLVDMAKDDEQFQLGVLNTHVEALYNLTRMVKDSAVKIGIDKNKSKEIIHLSPPMIQQESGEPCSAK